jgi:hypothetical protein
MGASVVSLFVGVANVGDDVDMIGAAEGACVGAEVGLSDCVTAGVGDAIFIVGADEGALVGASVVSLFVGVANVGDDVDRLMRPRDHLRELRSGCLIV